MPYKNKTLATALALSLGGLGAHRFYLHGGVDRIGVLHACSLPIAGLVYSQTDGGVDVFYALLPLLVSYIAAFIAALAIGLTPDEKWDGRFNAGAAKRTESTWILAVLLVATLMVGATVLIATISRLFDLMYTGGAYG